MVDILVIRPSSIVESGPQNSLFEQYIYLARKFMKAKIGFEGTEGLHLPVGLTYIASKLEQDGFSVKALDLYLPKYFSKDGAKTQDDALRIVRETLAREKPALVCIECMYSRAMNESLRIAKAVKEYNTAVYTILGGVQATFFDADIIKDQNVDFVVRGEAELVVSQLARYLLRKEGKLPDGITYKDKGKIKRIRNAPRIADLDALPFPARHLFPTKELYTINNSTDFVISSRGCPSSCAFCINKAFWKKCVYFRSSDNVMAEINDTVSRYGAKHLCFYDETFGLNADFTHELCTKMKREQPNLAWAIETRLDTLNKPTFKKLADANCQLVYFGFESFSDLALHVASKRVKFGKSIQTLKDAKDVGIKSIMGTFIIGLPGETYHSTMATIKTAEELVRDGYIDICYFLPLMPFPGSELCRDPERFGIKILTKDFDKYYYILDNPVTLETQTLNSAQIKELHTHALERMVDAIKYRMGKDGVKV